MDMPKALNLNPIQLYTYACDQWRVKSKMYERKKKYIRPSFLALSISTSVVVFFLCKEKRNLCKYRYAIFIIFILLRIRSLFNPVSFYIYGLLFLSRIYYSIYYFIMVHGFHFVFIRNLKVIFTLTKRLIA